MSAPCADPVTGNYAHLAHRDLVERQLWERLVNRIVTDERIERALAERIMDQALAFLSLCAGDPDGNFSPAPLVDIGWHTFILYTKPYADFCHQACGRFIHHAPSDVDGVDYGKGNVARTVAALRARGFAVDEPLWADTRQDCGDSGDCTSGDGCSIESDDDGAGA
ncbi:glycine-rich domain-containing protein [Mycobacterium parmense]|uniref:Uncharacterized protein n=1 Tax=Mycobacterium parmense TaxID=185642 RepID=A0A7I7YVB7_9MYCO|nr:hypothetical protein [Mycobacterium parmense]MCV7351604.1 hypothetical protein [Mycobacterium parmense]ORW62483.1 hypothetical protein AWC20_05295 [Mycobacterium parmense]BBZ44933.1 hypothetical protein MPRM_22140 [Mycobacterium parmense]